MSVSAAQHTGTAERYHISIEMTEASAAVTVLLPQLMYTRDVSTYMQDIVGGLLCARLCSRTGLCDKT